MNKLYRTIKMTFKRSRRFFLQLHLRWVSVLLASNANESFQFGIGSERIMGMRLCVIRQRYEVDLMMAYVRPIIYH